MRKKLYLVLVSFLLVSGSIIAQERNCATMEYLEMQMQNDPGLEQRMAEIEAHTQNYIQNGSNLSVSAEILYVPIVVHIVWNSANPVENISDAQIMSQIDVIYKDFRRLNEDADSTWPQAADMEIEFYLAQEDPDGNPTNGITRTETNVASWGTSDDIKFSSSGGVDAWDTTRYFNFWVGNIGGGILGYATFPTSAGDPNDGIVMSPQYFGSSDYEAAAGETFYLSAPYDKGRTTTHEMGHYFNLFHIWGDDGTSCTGSDLVDDTPNQAGSTFGAPTGVQTDSCSPSAPGFMYQNYMDYTDDAAMNLFTEDQKARMRATLEAGGPREVLNQPLDFNMTLATSEIDVCAPADAVFDFTYNTYNDFTDTTTFAAVGLPAGATATFSPTSASADGTAVTLTVSGTGVVTIGSYGFTVEGTSGTTVRASAATLGVYDTNYATLAISSPADGATDVLPNFANFLWDEDPNATSYEIDIASDASFTSIVDSGAPDTNSYLSTILSPNSSYFWRVRSVNDCGLGLYSSSNFSTADVTCDSYPSTDTPIAIPDGNASGINSVLNVSTTRLISDVNVTVNITHTWVSDLILTLTSPNGTSVILSNRNGGSGDNYTNTVFDQEAAVSITATGAPFTGTFQPEEDLSVLNGEFSGGDWILNVSDNVGFDTGNIESWSIEICGEIQTDNDGDGIPNGSDNCPDTANADQADMDTDGIGDVCDDDIDGDGVLNVDDNCPETANADQADADSDGIGDLCDTECQSFTSFDTPIDISATTGGTYTSVINIQDDLPVDDVNVKINIDHAWDADLNISLESPSGLIVDLSSGNGGGGDNYTDTIFDDEAATPITAGSPPFSDTFQPEGSLSSFIGESSLGDWTLIVTDTFGPLDGGVINLFELELCVVGEFSEDTDGDGVIDPVDNCVDIANNDQSDIDGDGLGDVCDDDIDGDGVLNAEDNCPENANPDQVDIDGDGIGNFCDIECATTASADTPLEISDGPPAVYEVTVMVMEPVTITDVNVKINISHTFVSDLLVGLISPEGTPVLLTNGNGGAGDNYTDTVFDQDADDPITSGFPPFTGTFVPEGDLSDFNGEQAPGEWTLVVIDNFNLDGGSINLVELEICGLRDQIDYDADGILDDDDNCVFIANADQSDLDNDGLGDSCDPDIDNDGVLNEEDNCPFTVNADQSDIDGDGLGDVCDPDKDNDTVLNEDDNCPETPNVEQYDVDGDGIGDACDGLIVNDVLTPNGDGFNDTWQIINLERFQNAIIHVYNRWGNEVFSSADYGNNWNGTSGGNALPAGSYFYRIDQNGDGTEILTGWIYITY